MNELRVAGITTLEAANRYLVERFLPDYNATFARAPREPASAFVPLGDVDLDPIPCHEEEPVVAGDNTASFSRRVLQIAAQPGRRSCAGLRVTVREHLDGRFTITAPNEIDWMRVWHRRDFRSDASGIQFSFTGTSSIQTFNVTESESRRALTVVRPPQSEDLRPTLAVRSD